MIDDFWQHYQLQIDPWGLDYDLPVQVGDGSDHGPEGVAFGFEGEAWRAIAPDPLTPLPARLLFIDGSRRLDARLVGRVANEVVHGAFATLAAGAVLVDREASVARCLTPTVRRVLAFGGNLTARPVRVPCPLGGPGVLDYDHCLTSTENTPQTPIALVQGAMLTCEADLARDYVPAGETLVVRDGPLRRTGIIEPIVGYVKTMHKGYLPAERAGMLWELALGERTPIFAIGEPGTGDRRWSWYMRSGQVGVDPKRMGLHGLYGLVRLELSDQVPLERARAIANQTARLIPTYASQPHRDPRAPQNLTPVGALERELGRHMGDPGVIMRRLRHFLAHQALAAKPGRSGAAAVVAKER